MADIAGNAPEIEPEPLPQVGTVPAVRSTEPSPWAVVSVLMVFASFHASALFGSLAGEVAHRINITWEPLFRQPAGLGLLGLGLAGAVSGFACVRAAGWSRAAGLGAGLVNVLLALSGLGLLLLEASPFR